MQPPEKALELSLKRWGRKKKSTLKKCEKSRSSHQTGWLGLRSPGATTTTIKKSIDDGQQGAGSY